MKQTESVIIKRPHTAAYASYYNNSEITHSHLALAGTQVEVKAALEALMDEAWEGRYNTETGVLLWQKVQLAVLWVLLFPHQSLVGFKQSSKRYFYQQTRSSISYSNTLILINLIFFQRKWICWIKGSLTGLDADLSAVAPVLRAYTLDATTSKSLVGKY